MVGFSARPDNGGGVGDVSVLRGLASLIDVLGQPAEALAVALPLQHTAHEHLQWSRVQLLQGNVPLGGKKKQEKIINKSPLGEEHLGKQQRSHHPPFYCTSHPLFSCLLHLL